MIIKLILILLLIAGTLFIMDFDEDEDEDEENYFQGPVPFGYDLEYFRKTGETIKVVNNA